MRKRKTSMGNPPPDNPTARQERIETKLDALITSMSQFREDTERRFGRIESTQRDAERSRQLNWPIVLAAIGVLLSVVSVAGSLVVAHVNGSVSLEHAYTHDVETKLFWSNDAEAGERADNAQKVQLLWHKVYGEELPPKNPYERGPEREIP